ncbi:MAG: ABC transporter permease [Planctomycetota bacterium]|nr:ABC transporter permease [Planctomycetota bacterium]
MSDASANVYRASWLAWPARLVCWPLAAMYVLCGVLWRVLALPFVALFEGDAAESGMELGIRLLHDFAVGGIQYLGFQHDELPALSGRTRKEGETHGPWWEAKRRLLKSHVAMVSVIVFVAYLYVGLGAQVGWIAPNFKDGQKEAEFLHPFSYAPADGEGHERLYVLGSDQLGRDVLDLALRGTTTALWIGLFAATISSILGMFLGSLAGYFGGWVDDVIVWAYTTLSAIPYLLLLIAISYVFKSNPSISEWYTGTFLYKSWDVSPGLFRIIVIIGLTSWVGTCRIVRAEFIKHRDRDYVLAARSLGFSTPRIIFRHILPNVFHLVLITFSLLFIGAIKFEVILSFLGLGLEPAEASWGNMISKGAGELLRADTVWWQITTATVALFGIVLAINLLSDALRDALDPRLRK